MKPYVPTLEDRVEEIIQDHLDGNLRKDGPMARRGRRARLIPKTTIIEEAVRRKFAAQPPVNEPKAFGPRMGRPPRLSRADEFELYCYRKSGVSIRTCASMYRVSVPTANRIIAKFRAYDDRIEPVAREFRERIEALRDST